VVEKSAVAVRFIMGDFVEDYEEDNYIKHIIIDGIRRTVNVMDIYSGQVRPYNALKSHCKSIVHFS
jgi:hypothetical protein